MPLNLGQRLAATAQADAPSESVLNSAVLAIRGRYSFAVDGGAVDDIPLTSGTPIPEGAIVIGGYLDVIATVTGGAGSTLALSVEGAGDLAAAEAVATFAIDLFHVLPALTSGDLTTTTPPIKTTAPRDIVLTVGTDPLTAGIFDVVLLVILPA